MDQGLLLPFCSFRVNLLFSLSALISHGLKVVEFYYYGLHARPLLGDCCVFIGSFADLQFLYHDKNRKHGFIRNSRSTLLMV